MILLVGKFPPSLLQKHNADNYEENYISTSFSWSSDRLGIFGNLNLRFFIVAIALSGGSEKKLADGQDAYVDTSAWTVRT